MLQRCCWFCPHAVGAVGCMYNLIFPIRETAAIGRQAEPDPPALAVSPLFPPIARPKHLQMIEDFHKVIAHFLFSQYGRH